MNKFVLTCCSTADMTEEYFKAKSIPFACFYFTLDGKDYPDDYGKSMPISQFYSRISEGAMPTTSQVNVAQFCQMFEPILKENKDILHVTLSTGLSGAYNSACVARDELMEKYPDRKICVVDSLGASSGYGLLVDSLADMRDNGATLEEAFNWAEENKLNIHHWFFSTDLAHFKRGGRISATAATFGTLLGICPLMNMDNLGRLIPRTKVKGKKKVIKEMVKTMQEHAQGGLNYCSKCFISNSACLDDAKEVASLVEQTFTKLNGKVQIYNVGTVIGSHTGPGTVALFFYGDKRVN
ncbi:MAG: DegV family protein [Clostridia bacterium]